MEFEELKKLSITKVLLRAKSGRGKTRTACKVALEVSRAGGKVKYVDTESEGSTTLVAMVESSDNDYSPEDVENIDYVQCNNFDTLMDEISNDNGNNEDYDLLIVDTLDHKHSYVLKHVTDAKLASKADWNQYPHIYSQEKEIMESLGKANTNVLATLDPDSGSIDKPKGAQTNIHGYFTVVIELVKDDDGWGNRIRNWVGKGDAIGKKHPRIDDALTEEILARTEVEQ